MLNKETLRYYLDSDRYFRSFLLYFFDLFGHISYCESQKGNRYEFASAIAVTTFEREQANAGFVFLNEPAWLQKYYTKEYSDEQLFAVIFGAWYGLSEKACQILSNKTRRAFVWPLLNCLLCGMTCEEITALLNDKNKLISDKKKILDSVEYTGTCEIFMEDKKILATKIGEILTDTNGEIYKKADG